MFIPKRKTTTVHSFNLQVMLSQFTQQSTRLINASSSRKAGFFFSLMAEKRSRDVQLFLSWSASRLDRGNAGWGTYSESHLRNLCICVCIPTRERSHIPQLYFEVTLPKVIYPLKSYHPKRIQKSLNHPFFLRCENVSFWGWLIFNSDPFCEKVAEGDLKGGRR